MSTSRPTYPFTHDRRHTLTKKNYQPVISCPTPQSDQKLPGASTNILSIHKADMLQGHNSRSKEPHPSALRVLRRKGRTLRKQPIIFYSNTDFIKM